MDPWKEATPSSSNVYNGDWTPVGHLWNDINGTTLNNVFSANEAKKARDFEAFMSSTAMQRMTDDLRAAGLNPALAVGNGSATGASSPSGSAGSAASGVNPGGVASAVSKIASTAMLDATKEKMANTAKNGGDLHSIAKSLQALTKNANSALSRSSFDNGVSIPDTDLARTKWL